MWHHPGKAFCDEDAFEDWDESCHGRMDTKANRREYPECFLWNCCGCTLTSRGCVARVPGASGVPGDNGSVSSDTESDCDRADHPGELKVDSNEWDNHDEDVHGDIDTAANRRDYPDGFKWTCCGGQADAPGCQADDNEDEGEEEED